MWKAEGNMRWLTNFVDPDEMQQNAASHQDLYSLYRFDQSKRTNCSISILSFNKFGMINNEEHEVTKQFRGVRVKPTKAIAV